MNDNNTTDDFGDLLDAVTDQCVMVHPQKHGAWLQCPEEDAVDVEAHR